MYMLKRILQMLCIFASISLLAYLFYGIWQESRIPIKANETTSFTHFTLPASPSSPSGTYQASFIETSYKGYPTIATLAIPSIELDVPVFATYTEETLSMSATKFYGPNPNTTGNFCIVGHNYNRENMFHNLKNVSIGDTLFLTDAEHGRGTYHIASLYKVAPTDISPLSQETNGETQITLITCTNYSNMRLIVKATKI